MLVDKAKSEVGLHAVGNVIGDQVLRCVVLEAGSLDTVGPGALIIVDSDQGDGAENI